MIPLPALPFIIGRDEKLPLSIDDPQASRKHCVIKEGGEDVLKIEDLRSTNGTFLNGRKITKADITDGDRVKIGETIVEFSKASEVSVHDDTGQRRLAILKSFSVPKKAAGAAAEVSHDDKAAVLERIGGEGKGVSSVNQQRLTLVADIARFLTEDLDRDTILQRILDGLLKVYPIDRVAVLLKKDEMGTLEPVLSRHKESLAKSLVISRTICQHVYGTGQAIVTEDAVVDPRFSSGDSIIEHRIGSVVAAPITARGELKGVLYASTSESAAHFTEQDLGFLALIGNLVALTILLDEVNLDPDRTIIE